MEWPGWVTLVVVIGTFIYGALGLRGKSHRDYMDTLRGENSELRQKVKDCMHELRRLQDENQWLRDKLRERD